MTTPSRPGTPTAPRDAAEAFSLTVHDAPPPEADLVAARRRGGRRTMLAILALCAAPVVASYLMFYVVRPNLRTTNYATLIQPQRTIPDALPLRTLAGTPVRPASLRKQWLVIVVGPAACDTACERRLFLQHQLREMVGAERDRVDNLWLLDDAAGTEPPVRGYVDQVFAHAPGMTVLRTDRAALAQWLQPEPGHALEDHVYVVDPMGNWMMRTPVDPDPMKFKKDLERLLKASESWDTAGR